MNRFLVIGLAFLLFASPVVAASSNKYGTGGEVLYTFTDTDTDGVLSWGDTITLTATPPSSVDWAGDIQGECYVGWVSAKNPGTLVYVAYDFLSLTWVRSYVLYTNSLAESVSAYCHFWGIFPTLRKFSTFGDIYFSVAP